MVDFQNRVGFAVGTGRCGTKFLHLVVREEPHVASSHERNVLNESFHRYCKWYGVPVDHEGFLYAKEVEIQQDLTNHLYSFEASAQLSASIIELYDRFKAHFLFIVRSPHRVVNSYLCKGYYQYPYVRAEANLALGYQSSRSFHHFLGRLAPSGNDFERWNQMTRVGKIAWLWNAVNSHILEQLKSIPRTHWLIEKLENLSYKRYQEVAAFLGFHTTISQDAYEDLCNSRPNSLKNAPTVHQWTPSEIVDFQREVEPLAIRLGYTYNVEELKRAD